EHAGTVLDVAGRKQLALQDFHNDGSFSAVKAARVTVAILLGKELRRPFIVVVPQLLEQLPGEAAPSLDFEGIHNRDDSILGELWPLKEPVLGDGGLMMYEAPQPRHIDPVGGQVIHEAQGKFIVVNRRCEIPVEDLEAVV